MNTVSTVTVDDPPIKDILREMERAQVVRLIDPNGNNLGLVKGEDLLEHVIKSGRSRSVQICTIPVDGAGTAEFVTALDQVAGRRTH